MTADVISLPVPEREPLPPKHRAGIRERLQQIGEALELPPAEIDRAASDMFVLIDFAQRHGQSLDWIVFGDPQPMIRMLNRVRQHIR